MAHRLNGPVVAREESVFHPTAPYYATLSSKSLVRVYDTQTQQCIHRYSSTGEGSTSAEGDVTALEWVVMPGASKQKAVEDRKKKKRRTSSAADEDDEEAEDSSSAVLALGLSNGSILLLHFSAGKDTPRETPLNHPSSTSSIVSLSFLSSTAINPTLASLHKDGSVRLWDLAGGKLLARISIAYSKKQGVPELSDLLVRLVESDVPPTSQGKDSLQLLLARSGGIAVYHITLTAGLLRSKVASSQDAAKGIVAKVKDVKAVEVGRAAGHVGQTKLQWFAAQEEKEGSDEEQGLAFLSYAPQTDDRFVHLWSLSAPAGEATVQECRLVARLGLAEPVQGVVAAAAADDDEDDEVLLAAWDASGNLSLSRVDGDLPSRGTGSGKPKVVALAADATATVPVGQGVTDIKGVYVLPGKKELQIVRGSVKPVFETLTLFHPKTGHWTASHALQALHTEGYLVGSTSDKMDEDAPIRSAKIYEATTAAAPPAGVLTNGTPNGKSKIGRATRVIESDDEDEEPAGAAVPDVEIADDDELLVAAAKSASAGEPTLAERMRALEVRKKTSTSRSKPTPAADEDDEDEDDEEDSESDDSDSDAEEGDGAEVARAPSTTLSTTLIQALHSGDAPLLESCLAHSSQNLIRSTVKRLPSGTLVLKLLDELVDRLAKGKGGREGLASARRGKALVQWLRETVVVHLGFLVTIPSLVQRLATLHGVLSTRLALQPSLLALNGRLELVNSQIDLSREKRVHGGPAASSGVKALKGKKAVRRYVEGQSEGEDEGDSDDEGSVEDVALGVGGEEDEEESGDENAGLDAEEEEEEENDTEAEDEDSEEEDDDDEEDLMPLEDEYDSDESDEENEVAASRKEKKSAGKIKASMMVDLSASEEEENDSEEDSEEEDDEEDLEEDDEDGEDSD